jgi:hypothetical protein
MVVEADVQLRVQKVVEAVELDIYGMLKKVVKILMNVLKQENVQKIKNFV